MRKNLTVLFVFFFVLFTSFAFMPRKADAIPAWSQKYHFSCAVCHTTFPNLNPFGRAFWRNGFRLPSTNGTPSDATQISQGLTLSNPWPVPIMIEGYASYTHQIETSSTTQADTFTQGNFLLAFGGSFPLSVPVSNSISFYILSSPQEANMETNISINGLGWGFGVPSHLLNLKLGTMTPAGPYFDKLMGIYMVAGPEDNMQSLNVGADTQARTLAGGSMNGYTNNPGQTSCTGCHAVNGISLFGALGHHLWYKAIASKSSGTNATQYSYQLKEYMPLSMGKQLEFGYYGAITSEPLVSSNNMVMVNGIDVDLANNVYELGATYMIQNDSSPYGPSGVTLSDGSTQKSNGYGQLEIYGRYMLPQVGYGLMFSADYSQYAWMHKDAQEIYDVNNSLNGASASCTDAGLYQNASSNFILPDGCGTEGVQHALTLQAEYNLAYNAHLWLDYILTNQFKYNTFGAGIDIAL